MKSAMLFTEKCHFSHEKCNAFHWKVQCFLLKSADFHMKSTMKDHLQGIVSLCFVLLKNVISVGNELFNLFNVSTENYHIYVCIEY